MPPTGRNAGPLGTSTNSTGGRRPGAAGSGLGSRPGGSSREYTVRFGRSDSGEPILFEMEGGKRATNLTFKTKDLRNYYRKGDLIGRGNYRWDQVVKWYPDFSDLPEPITEDPQLKTLGLLTGELPSYEVGFRIEEIIPVTGKPYEGIVLVRPYLMLTPDQSGEEHRKYFLSNKTISWSMNQSGGSLKRIFYESRLVYQMEQPGGGVWFGKLAVKLTTEVLSLYGSKFTGAAKEALKHALGVGAKKMAKKYAARYIAKKGRQAAVKRMVAKVFARLAKIALFFNHAATKAAIAFLSATAVDLLKQSKDDVKLLTPNGGASSMVGIVSNGPAAQVVASNNANVQNEQADGTSFQFAEPTNNNAIDWKHAFAVGISKAIEVAVATVIADKIEKHLKFNNDLDEAMAKELGNDGLEKGVQESLKQAFKSKMLEELWTNNSTTLISAVGDVAADPATNASNFSSRVTDKLKDKVTERLKTAFGGIPAMFVGQGE